MKLKITAGLVLLCFALTVTAKTIRLKFDMKYEFAKGGEVEITIYDTIYKNKPATIYHMRGWTTGLADALYKVDDEYKTIVDPNTMLPLRSIRNLKENKYRHYSENHYYHDIDSVYNSRKGWLKVPDNIVDFVSIFFYYTKYYLQNDSNHVNMVTLPCINGNKVTDVTIKNLGIRNLKTSLGQVETHALATITSKGKLLIKSDAMVFYISKKEKVPVQLEFDTKFGDLVAVLRSYKIDGIEQVIKQK